MTTNHSLKNKRIRILVFDCWLPGFLYIRDLAEMEGVSLTYVHNSESQLGQPAKEYRDFKTRLQPPAWVKDFNEFNKDFRRLFEEINPDIVLVTSMHYVEHRSALLFAREYGVLRAFIPHGIFQLHRSENFDLPEKRRDIATHILEKLPRAYYYTNLFWSSHFQRRPIGRGTFRNALICFFDLLLCYSDWQWRPAKRVQRYYANLLNVALVYDRSLETYYLKNSGDIFNNTKFIVSGTLDSGKLLRSIRGKPSLLQSSTSTVPFAYYISSPYPEFFTEDGAAVLASILKTLKSVVISAGCSQLVYRPHPGEPGWFVDLVCAVAGLKRDTDPGIEGLIRANLICGTSSSLLYNAILLEKPIVLLTSGKVRLDLPYYEPLISYPKTTIDLDLKPEFLIENHGATISASMANKGKVSEVLVADPLETLIEYCRAF